MVVSMDVGELNETARALGRVVEATADKHGIDSLDHDVLERLVDAVTRGSASIEEAKTQGGAQNDVANPNEGLGLFRNVNDLFNRVLLPRLSSQRLYRAYARLLKWQGKWEEALRAYMEGYRCSNAAKMERGEADVGKWREAVGEVEDIVDILRNFGPKVEGYKWKSQARSVVRTFVARSKDFEDEPEWARLVELQEELKNSKAED